ncbi:MAG: hypothetical protein WHV44_04855 [Anaerolineales bacterium]
MHTKHPALLFILSVLLLTACAPKNNDAERQRAIAQAVIATIAAMPTATPYPTYPPPPTPRPPLQGVFCEYGFCIGHPVDFPLFDLNVVEKGVGAPSTYGSGKLLGFKNEFAFITVFWVQSTGTWDPSGLIGVALSEFGDTPNGSLDIDLVGPLNVAALPLTPNEAITLRAGLAANWRCGDRDFVWKVYTQSEGQARELLREALGKFDCGQ